MQLDRRWVLHAALRALSLLVLLVSGVTPDIVSSAEETASAPSPAAATLRDGPIFVGAALGDSTSSGQLILEKNFLHTKRLRWQSTDEALGPVDSDFFQPRDWQIREEPFKELVFVDRSPDPAMRGRVMLGAPNKALVEIVVGDEMSTYQLLRADIGLRFIDGPPDGADSWLLARNPEEITAANFAAQKCHMRALRVSGPGHAVLKALNDRVVEIFDLAGKKWSLPLELKSLPIVLLVSGAHSGTTGLRVDYTLPDHSTLEQEIAVRVGGEIPAGQACPVSTATGAAR